MGMSGAGSMDTNLSVFLVVFWKFVPLRNTHLRRIPVIGKPSLLSSLQVYLKSFPSPPHTLVVPGFSSLSFQNSRISTPSPRPFHPAHFCRRCSHSGGRVDHLGIQSQCYSWGLLYPFPLPSSCWSASKAQMKSWSETHLSCKNTQLPGSHGCYWSHFSHGGCICMWFVGSVLGAHAPVIIRLSIPMLLTTSS